MIRRIGNVREFSAYVISSYSPEIEHTFRRVHSSLGKFGKFGLDELESAEVCIDSLKKSPHRLDELPDSDDSSQFVVMYLTDSSQKILDGEELVISVLTGSVMQLPNSGRYFGGLGFIGVHEDYRRSDIGRRTCKLYEDFIKQEATDVKREMALMVTECEANSGRKLPPNYAKGNSISFARRLGFVSTLGEYSLPPKFFDFEGNPLSPPFLGLKSMFKRLVSDVTDEEALHAIERYAKYWYVPNKDRLVFVNPTGKKVKSPSKIALKTSQDCVKDYIEEMMKQINISNKK